MIIAGYNKFLALKSRLIDEMNSINLAGLVSMPRV